jgi:phospholipid/cholesterol/gamma-HCH transport system substrate-binding protein
LREHHDTGHKGEIKVPRKVSSFYVGIFIIITIFLALAITFWVGFSHLFEKKKFYVSYFSESVKGLQKDAAVNYLGVPVGRVKKIGIAPDGRLIEVLLAISEDFIVDDTLVVRLREQGITGLRFLEIDKAPPDTDSLTPQIAFTPPYPVIRSYPSEMQAIKDALERLYGKIVSIDFEGIAKTWTETASSVQKILSSPEIETSIKSVSASAKNLHSFTDDLHKALKKEPPEKILRSADEFFKEAKNATMALNTKLASLDWGSVNKSLTAVNENIATMQKTIVDLDQNLNATLIETQKVLKELQATIEEIKREPGRLIVSPSPHDPFAVKSAK